MAPVTEQWWGQRTGWSKKRQIKKREQEEEMEGRRKVTADHVCNRIRWTERTDKNMSALIFPLRATLARPFWTPPQPMCGIEGLETAKLGPFPSLTFSASASADLEQAGS